MTIVKYKVIGSITDRFYYSRIIDVDDQLYPTEDDRRDFINDEIIDEVNFFDPSNWKDEGSECVAYFSLDEINKI